MRRLAGFTLIEVMVALAILLIVIAASVGIYVTGFRSNGKAQLSTEGSQVVAGLAGQVTQHQISLADGASQIIVYKQGPSPTPDTSLTPTSCSSFLQTDRSHLCATVTNQDAFDPTVTVSSTTTSLLAKPMRHYHIKVCWSAQGGVDCAEADTLY